MIPSSVINTRALFACIIGILSIHTTKAQFFSPPVFNFTPTQPQYSYSKKYHYESGGFEWYEVTRSDGKTSAQTESGSTIVPFDDNLLFDYTSENGMSVFIVTGWKSKDDYKAVYSLSGNCIISYINKFSDIVLESSKDGYYYKVEKNGLYGICNTKGRYIIEPSYSEIGYDEDTHSFYSGSYSSRVSLNVGLTSSSSVSSSNSAPVIIQQNPSQPRQEQYWHQCTWCNGSGNCHDCAGTGIYGRSYCGKCGGNGRCHICAGRGGEYRTRTIY